MPTMEKLFDGFLIEDPKNHIDQEDFLKGDNNHELENKIFKLKNGFYQLRALQKFYNKEIKRF
jgi:hypothetical protein